MRVPILIACTMFWVAHAAELAAPEYGTAYEMASGLSEIEARQPYEHRILSDGTWDSYGPSQKIAFLDKLQRSLMGTGPETRAEGRRIRAMERTRSRLLEAGRHEQVRLLDESTTRIHLRRLSRMENRLRRARLAREGNADAAAEEERKVWERLLELLEEHPDAAPPGLDLDELFHNDPEGAGSAGKSPAANQNPPGTIMCIASRAICYYRAAQNQREAEEAAEEQFAEHERNAEAARATCLNDPRGTPSTAN